MGEALAHAPLAAVEQEGEEEKVVEGMDEKKERKEDGKKEEEEEEEVGVLKDEGGRRGCICSAGLLLDLAPRILLREGEELEEDKLVAKED